MPNSTLPFHVRLSKVLRKRANTQQPPQQEIEISAPFNFKHESGTTLPGVSPDQLTLMREQAMASVALVTPTRKQQRSLHKATSSRNLQPFRPGTS